MPLMSTGIARPALGLVQTLLTSVTLCLLLLARPAVQVSPLTNEEYDRFSAAVDQVVTGGTICDVGRLPQSATRPDTVVAVIDYSGRLFCNTVARVNPTAPPELLQEISGWWVGTLAPGGLELIQDVDGDGEHELIVPTAISDYEGTRACIATLPHVYRCDARRCVDVSDEVPDFFRRWRRQLTERLREVRAAADDSQRRDVPCLRMAAHKADRFAGGSSAATVALADEWARSTDRYLRRKAVWMLSDVWVETADPAIRRRLERLARGGDQNAPIVRWLERRRRAGVP